MATSSYSTSPPENAPREPFGRWMRRKRVEADIKQDVLAASWGKSQQAVSKIEAAGMRGVDQVPRREDIPRLAAALRLTVREVMEAAGYADLGVSPPAGALTTGEDGRPQIVLESGETYTVLTELPNGALELEVTPELLEALRMHAELQRFRRQKGG